MQSPATSKQNMLESEKRCFPLKKKKRYACVYFSFPGSTYVKSKLGTVCELFLFCARSAASVVCRQFRKKQASD